MDSANREEALKALSIARRHLAASPPNLPTAKRLALKSVALCETSEAVELLERIRKLEEESNDDANSNSKTPGSSTATANGSAKHGPSTHASGAEPFAGSEGIKHRTAKHSSTVDSSSSNTSSARDKGKGRDDEKRDYTPDQLAVVQRIRKCKVTEYYEIMSLKKDCEDADIKKAYRKLALQLHPDKNGAPGADEAFKMVSKAFQVLSDSTLRAAFDRDGGDPESRFGSGMRSSGTGRSPFDQSGGFEGELSPEDVFNMFFGAGAFGGGFGGPGVQFGGGFGGGPTIYVNGFPLGGQRVRTRQAGANAGAAGVQRERPTGIKGAILQLLPIILFLVFAFSNTIFDLLAAALTTPDPKYSFVKSSHYSYERVTGGVSVHYFVNPTQFAVHPIYTTSHPTGGDTTKTPVVMRSSGSSASPTMRRFEKGIEERWVNWKYGECVKGKERLARKVDAMTGLFGIGTDWEAVRKLQKEQIESCEELRSKGYQV